MIAFSPRRWQSEAEGLAFASYRSGKKILTIVAPPGSGKTKQAANLSLTMLRAGLADRFFIVAPTLKIKKQWIEILSEFDLRAGGIEEFPSKSFNAFVLLYQNLGKYSRRLAQVVNSQDLAILDECHHCGDRMAWGKNAFIAFERALKYNVSGTLWREDKISRIPFVEYDSNGLSRADFYYSHQDAVSDGVCRPIKFIAHDAKGERGRMLSEMLSEKVARAHSRALHVETDFISQMLESFVRQIRQTRENFPASAGLIICKDITHANLIGELMAKQHSENPSIVHSDDDDSLARLELFCKGSEPFIISVQMISEGVDNPNFVGELFLSRVKTERYFHQAAGRIVRVSPDSPREAFMHIPAIEQYLTFARNLGSIRLHQLAETPERERTAEKRKKKHATGKEKREENFEYAGAFNVDEHLNGLADLRTAKTAANKATFRVAARCGMEVNLLHTAWFKLCGKYSDAMNLEEFRQKLRWANELYEISRGYGGKKIVQNMVVEIAKLSSAR